MEAWRRRMRIAGRTRYNSIEEMKNIVCGFYRVHNFDDKPPLYTVRLDATSAWMETPDYRGPASVQWKPLNGEVVFIYEDGTEVSMYSRCGISLVDEEGRYYFRRFAGKAGKVE